MRIVIDGKIVAYTKGETFTRDELRTIARDLKTYCFYARFGELVVQGDCIENAIKALGVGVAYEESWGDFQGLIEEYRKGRLECLQSRAFVVPLPKERDLDKRSEPESLHDLMLDALSKLRLEAIHYRNTGAGKQFLDAAISQAENAINRASDRKFPNE